MQQTVGFTATGAVAGLLVAMIAMTAIVASFVVVVGLRRKGCGSFCERALLAQLATAVLVSCIASEIWILADEQRFAAEVQQKRSGYGRDRVWPNSNAALFFDPHTGIRATD